MREKNEAQKGLHVPKYFMPVLNAMLCFRALLWRSICSQSFTHQLQTQEPPFEVSVCGFHVGPSVSVPLSACKDQALCM